MLKVKEHIEIIENAKEYCEECEKCHGTKKIILNKLKKKPRK